MKPPVYAILWHDPYQLAPEKAVGSFESRFLAERQARRIAKACWQYAVSYEIVEVRS